MSVLSVSALLCQGTRTHRQRLGPAPPATQHPLPSPRLLLTTSCSMTWCSGAVDACQRYLVWLTCSSTTQSIERFVSIRLYQRLAPGPGGSRDSSEPSSSDATGGHRDMGGPYRCRWQPRQRRQRRADPPFPRTWGPRAGWHSGSGGTWPSPRQSPLCTAERRPHGPTENPLGLLTVPITSVPSLPHPHLSAPR